MSDLIKELNQRQKKVHKRFSEQFFNAVYDYIDLTVHHPLLQEILKEQQAQPDSFHSIWQDYQKIHLEVYEFIRDNPYKVVKKKYSTYYSIDDNDVDYNFGKVMLIMNPFTLWALLKRLKYSFAIDRIHDGLVTSIKTRVSLSTPITVAQPQSLSAANQVSMVAEPKAKQHTEAYRALGLNDNSKWQDITIEFINIFDVKISYHGKTLDSDYVALGFADGRTKDTESGKRKKSWDTLTSMSLTKGVFNLDKYTGKQREQYKKHKQEISNILQAYFGLRSDPFDDFNDDSKTYHLKLRLIPDNGEIEFGRHLQLPEEYQNLDDTEN